MSKKQASITKKIYVLLFFISTLCSNSYSFHLVKKIPNLFYYFFSSKESQTIPIDACVIAKSSKELCKKILYLKKRKLHEKNAQDALAKKHLWKHHKIGLCFTGGGYRAMISSLGFIIGAKQIGLLDAATFTAALSGSTWDISTLLEEESAYTGDPSEFLEQFREKMEARTTHSFWNPTTFHWSDIGKLLLAKLQEYRKSLPDDLWGAIIADRLMQDLKHAGQNASFADIRSFLQKNHQYPFPLFSTIIKDTFEKEGEYEWFEINPEYAGSDYLGGFISTKYLGSDFKNGKMTKLRTEETLGFDCAIFGSPFMFNLGDLILQLIQSIPETNPNKQTILEDAHQFIKKHHLAKRNFLPSKMPNPTYNMVLSKCPKQYLTLSDAGFDCNLTLPPLLQKQTDIIICCDDSTDSCTQGFPELKLAQRYAKKHNLPFPSLTYYKPLTHKKEEIPHTFVFKWDKYGKTNKKIPTIIYLGNPINHSTFKLTYTKEEFEQLCAYMQKLIIQSKNAISQELAARDTDVAIQKIAKKIACFGDIKDDIPQKIAQKIVCHSQ